jgi:glycosyltransferase involved in cell wall biosynthesis
VVDCDDRESVGGWNDELPYPASAKALFAWQERDLPRVADAVTVASRTLQTLVWADGVLRAATFYVPNAANITQQPAFVPRTAPTLVLYTRFWEFDLSDMAAIMTQIVARRPDVHLHVIGTGENGEELRLAQLLAAHQIATHVTMHGWLQPADIPAVLHQASLALVPVSDTLINRARCSAKLLELLATGLVVVGHDVGEMRTFVQHGVNGYLVAPADLRAFVAAVCDTLDTPQQLTAMQSAAYQSAQQHAWETRVATCEAAYAYAMHP